MKIRIDKVSLWLIGSVFLFGLTGCEQINTLKEHLFGEDDAKTENVAQSPAGQPTKGLKATELARVGSWTITVDEFEERLAALKEVVPDYDIEDPQARRLVLEELVRQQLLVADAEQSGVAKEKDIKAAVDEFRRTLLVREVARKVTEGIEVTDAEARGFYEERKVQLVEPADYHVREIVIDDKVKASEIWSQILKGSDFAEMARLHSASESAPQGGDLGFITEEPFPAMAEAILSLKEGEVSNVFQGPDGYYIVKLEEKKGGEQIPYEDIKEDIIQNQLILKQQQAILDYIEKLKTKINVEVNEGLLK